MVVSTVHEHPAFVGHRTNVFIRAVPSEGGAESNGNGARDETPADEGMPPAPEDRASITLLMLQVAVTRSRLQAEIAAEQKRLAEAEEGSTPERRSAERELGALVLVAGRELAEIEREHREAIREIREAAVAEATQVLAAAREQAVAARERAALLTRRPPTVSLPSGSDD